MARHGHILWALDFLRAVQKTGPVCRLGLTRLVMNDRTEEDTAIPVIYIAKKDSGWETASACHEPSIDEPELRTLVWDLGDVVLVGEWPHEDRRQPLWRWGLEGSAVVRRRKRRRRRQGEAAIEEAELFMVFLWNREDGSPWIWFALSGATTLKKWNAYNSQVLNWCHT